MSFLLKAIRFALQRVVIIAVFILIQAVILVVIIWKFNEYFVYFYAMCTLLSLAVVLLIISSRSNPAYKIGWIIPILIFPVFGGLFYLMFGRNKLGRKTIEKMQKVSELMKNSLTQDAMLLKELYEIDESAGNQSCYINNWALSPLYCNTSTEYLPMGEVKFHRMLEELEKAEQFIFLEYFIIQEGKMWDSILEVLAKKAEQGVDVRVIYDDLGCIMTLPYQYHKKLESLGIRCGIYNPFVPVLSSRFNNRDHRKICIIDGHTGFTGGINLADEYINAIEKHGHWKDTALLLRGEAVWSLTVMFLSMWDHIRGEEEDYDLYRPSLYQKEKIKTDGFVQPFTDNPLDDEAVGETVYMNLINKANRFVYINTPYLIISNEMVTALTTAAKDGLDVRIITPHIPDKWYVHAVTRAYYEILVEAGVKIYEYSPGFIHAKSFVVDDKYAVVGTINLDYRSLYLHFECATWMYGTKSVLDIKEDYLQTLTQCQQISLEECQNVSWYRKWGRAILRVFAPLM